MCLGARPAVILGILNQISANRVLFHISKGDTQVPWRENAGIKPRLPKVAGTVEFGVEILRVTSIHPPHPDREGVATIRYNDEMNVVSHQTIAEQAYARLGYQLLHQIEVDVPIRRRTEDWLFVGTTLRDMVGVAWKSDSGVSCHGARLDSANQSALFSADFGGIGRILRGDGCTGSGCPRSPAPFPPPFPNNRKRAP